jgi:hypothetical protein
MYIYDDSRTNGEGERVGIDALSQPIGRVGWDFEYCGHYWPIVPAPHDR